MRDTILGKLREIEELLAGATCDGTPIKAGDEASGVGFLHRDLMGALRVLEEKVDYYVD
jgi:hypothetical protein